MAVLQSFLVFWGFAHCSLIMGVRLCIFGKNTMKTMLCLSHCIISNDYTLLCLITDDVIKKNKLVFGESHIGE